MYWPLKGNKLGIAFYALLLYRISFTSGDSKQLNTIGVSVFTD